ncbi:MAG TPA: hypothetical protein VHV08_05070 [Pirellulales bacterium]|nr:hypothetical protein [Pirellulales bacterium]
MSAKKRPAESPSTETAPRKGAPIAGWFLAGTLVLGVGAGVWYAVWRQVSEHVLAGSEYQVDPQKIVVTRPPPWIHSDIKSDVVREASFDGPLSLLDPELTVRLASAFASHPWVAHVERISKRFPSSVEVMLEYRRPVAMVEVSGGALPVDIAATVLPSGDFSREEAEAYPRIEDIHTAPSGSVGNHWGDAAVSGGARLAAALGNDWQALGLSRIVPGGRRPARSGIEYDYVLISRGGTRIDWGLAPGADSLNQSMVADKIAQLRQYANQHGSLDGDGGPQRLRFLESGQLEVERRTPVKSLPSGDR